MSIAKFATDGTKRRVQEMSPKKKVKLWEKTLVPGCFRSVTNF